MKVGTETEADKEDSEADPFAGFISGSCCFLPLAPFSARGVLIKDGRQLLCWDSLGEKYVSFLLFSETPFEEGEGVMDAIQRGMKTCLQAGEIHKHVGSSGKEGGEQSNGIRAGGLHLTWSRQGKVTILALTHLLHENSPHCLL